MKVIYFIGENCTRPAIWNKMMPAPSTPWDTSADSVSPDGRYRAGIKNANEIGMGAPTSGELVIAENNEEGKIIGRHASCNPSFVWSEDSTAIAVPQWTKNGHQRLSIVTIPANQVIPVREIFRVLQLESFKNGIIRGVDAPNYMPQRVEILAGEYTKILSQT